MLIYTCNVHSVLYIFESIVQKPSSELIYCLQCWFRSAKEFVFKKEREKKIWIQRVLKVSSDFLNTQRGGATGRERENIARPISTTQRWGVFVLYDC